MADVLLKEGDKGWTWKKSRTKARLCELLWSGELPLDGMEPAEVFQYEPLFPLETKYRLFGGRLERLCESIRKLKSDIDEDEAGLKRDRALYPMTTHDTRERLHWQGSPAELALRAHIKATFVVVSENGRDVKKHLREKMIPDRVLYDSNPEYNKYPYQIFRKHVAQEVKTQKYWIYRNNEF